MKFLRPTVALLAIGVLGVSLVACGGKSKPSSTSSPTVPPNTVERVNYKFPPDLLTEDPKDSLSAINISLVPGDLPNGYKAIDPRSSRAPRKEVVDEVFVQCLFGENPSPLTAYVASAVYASFDGNTVAKSFTRVVSSKTDAINDFSWFKADRISKCQPAMWFYEHNTNSPKELYGRKYASAAPSAMPVDTISAPDGSQDVLSFRMVVSSPDHAALHQDVFAYGAGRFEYVLLIQSASVPDEQLETKVITAAKTRVVSAALEG